MNPIYFDIETGPIESEKALEFAPEFSAPSNYKDADKIAAHKEQARKDWLDSCALRATSGKVLLIAYWKDGEVRFFDSADEARNIENFWLLWNASRLTGAQFIGFNILHFDLPFLIRRSWRLKVQVPPDVRCGRYFNNRFHDLMDAWTCGNPSERISLDALARFVGVGSKGGKGAEFHRLWAEDRQAAYDYAAQDIKLTRAISQTVGLDNERTILTKAA